MALLCLITTQFPDHVRRGQVIAAHFVHRTRTDEEHAADIERATEICARRGVPLFIGAIPSEFRSDAGGPEAGLRSARYQFLTRVAQASGAKAVVTAHHRQDQCETVLMRLLSGAAGTTLAGIPEQTQHAGVHVIRPLLDISPRKLREYLSSVGESWREDRTNHDLKYRRNLMRSVALPAIAQHWPAVEHDLCRLADAMRSVREAAEHAGGVFLREVHSVNSDDGVKFVIPRHEFFELQRDARLTVLYYLMQSLGALRRSSRPGHRFFAPLLGSDPPRTGTVLEGRGIRIALEPSLISVERTIVRVDESGYLRKARDESRQDKTL